MYSLKKELKKQLRNAKRVAILGIGSCLRGDDALGLRIVEDVESKLKMMKSKNSIPFKLFSCGTAPENFTGKIKSFKPTHIILIDAASMGKKPGTAGIIDLAQANTQTLISTHNLSIKMFADYLRFSIDCRIIPIGVQPQSLEFGADLSDKVDISIKRISDVIKDSIIEI